jgi:hypothetical protein
MNFLNVLLKKLLIMLDKLLPSLSQYKERCKEECEFIVSLQEIINQRIWDRLSHEWQNNTEGQKFIKDVRNYYHKDSDGIVFIYSLKEGPIDISDIIERMERRYIGAPWYEISRKLGLDGYDMPLGVPRLEIIVGEWRISPMSLVDKKIKEVILKMFIPNDIIFGKDF